MWTGLKFLVYSLSYDKWNCLNLCFFAGQDFLFLFGDGGKQCDQGSVRLNWKRVKKKKKKKGKRVVR